ncbi:hypothetical protein HPP92_028110, partial [Vanilla planifolia]
MEAGGHMSQLQLPILRRLSEVMLEKQLTSHKVDRSICGWFWDYVVSQDLACGSLSTHYLFQIFRDGIIFLACTQVEMPPLIGIEVTLIIIVDRSLKLSLN